VNYVLDANAMIAYLRSEDGAELVYSALTDSGSTCYAHAVNVCEVFYDFRRLGGEALAQEMLQDMRAAGLVVRDDMDDDFWQEAGRIKADFKRISLADCFCAVLANRVGGEVVTSDAEFKPLADAAAYTVRFIR
jgi:PIN domain nuclease of toxin-antitoxin system